VKSLLGKKLGMTQVFDQAGNITPVTLIEAGPCPVTQIKTIEKDGYESIQIGFEKIEKKARVKKPQTSKPFRVLKEFREIPGELKVGDNVGVSIFQEGQEVKVTGISKGKGFQGPVKRYGFKGRLSMSHGTKHELRNIGSIGSSMPERVTKGKRMAGHMGVARVSVKNLKIVKIDAEKNYLLVKGAVPGIKGSILEIRVK
jgi:large subunit ribosomal protein L3